MKTPSRSLVLQPLLYVYIASVLIVSLVLWSLGLPGTLLRVQASQLTFLTDTLSTSKPNTGSNHTIQFGTPTGVPADGSTIEVTIPSGFNVSTITEDDVDISDDGTDLTTGAVCGAVNASVTVVGQIITIEICSGGGGAIAPASTIVIEIGDNATYDGTGANQIVNHVTDGTYEVGIAGTMTDTGFTRIVIIKAITASGDVDNFFDFSILGVNAGITVNANLQTTTGTSTATSVPFGLVAPNTEYVIAQDLNVTTNSKNGFTVSVFADGNLESTSGATINSFTDGTDVASPAVWAIPSGTAGSPDTYGHWGLTTEDITLSDDDSFGDALYVGNFISSPREVMYATSSADGLADHIGKTRVGYKLEVSTLQEASSDYTTRLVYIATPVF
jgi:hypothetical protein